MSKRAIRAARGGGIVEGVVAVMTLLGGTVLGVLLLLNASGASYNKEKIGFIALQAAQFATNLPNDATRQGKVEAMVNGLLNHMGINSAGTTVTISDITYNSRAAVQVSVTSSCNTLCSGNFAAVLPGQIRMTHTAVAVKNGWFNGYMVFALISGQKGTVPLINGTGALPADGLPAYQYTVFNVSKIR